MKIALIHDWLMLPTGGAERVLKSMYEMFPAPIFTLIQDPEALRGFPFQKAEIHTSWIQHRFRAKTHFRSYLPLFPLAIESLDLSSYDLLLSSSHCVAKGVITHPEQLHICYCHTPMRYAWDLMHSYLKEAHLEKGLKGCLARLFLHYLRMWDASSSKRVDHFIANSAFVAKRITRYYGRSSTVIYPPVDTHFFSIQEKKDRFFVTASRLAYNKRTDVIVEAFSHLPNETLFVIGEGPERKRLESIATKNVIFLGKVPTELLRFYLQNARAFLFASVEDFGIVPVEAMACGTPVIALGKGGSLETVVEGETGLFFEEQTAQSLLQTLSQLEGKTFSPHVCRQRAEEFSQEKFHRQFQTFVLDRYIKFKKKSYEGNCSGGRWGNETLAPFQG